MYKLTRYLLIFIIPALLSTSIGAIDIKKASRDDLKRAFDVIIQNYGALEYSYYTFTIEFERPPKDFAELKSSGHLSVIMKDPYTDGEATVIDSLEKGRPGYLYYRKKSANDADFACWYANPNDPKKMRSLHSSIKIYTHKALQEAVFKDNASREEQLTRIYLLQMDDAVESYRQKTGQTPESVKELALKGDVNVNYMNPFTKNPAKQSEKLSPGDYFYRRFSKVVKRPERQKQEDGTFATKEVDKTEYYYEVVGWGKTEPVYYYSDDRTKEEFLWDDSMREGNIVGILDGKEEESPK